VSHGAACPVKEPQAATVLRGPVTAPGAVRSKPERAAGASR